MALPSTAVATRSALTTSLPELPPNVRSLIETTTTGRDPETGVRMGWSPPETLAASWTQPLSLWIRNLQDALAPMRSTDQAKRALVKVQSLLPAERGDAVQDSLWLEGMLEHVRPFPEFVVVQAARECETELEWRPRPKQLLARCQAKITRAQDELRRLQWLLDIARRPALPKPPEPTPDQRAQMADQLRRARHWGDLISPEYHGPLATAADFASDEAYDRFMAREDVRTALAAARAEAPTQRTQAMYVNDPQSENGRRRQAWDRALAGARAGIPMICEYAAGTPEREAWDQALAWFEKNETAGEAQPPLAGQHATQAAQEGR